MELPAFAFVAVHGQPLADGVAQEAQWMATCAAHDRAVAHLWRGDAGLVVPRRYAALPGFAAAAADATHGAVQVRASGGGLVPQGTGVWNLSLAWPTASATPVDTSGVYRALCDALAAALARLGVAAAPQPVAGSFCDGRYNLAAGGRKLVGTAQAWRRVGAVPVVLAHAVIVAGADPAALTARANAFEAALGTDTRYHADALTSIERECRPPYDEARMLAVLAEQFARVVPPRGHPPEQPHHGPA